MQDPCNTSICVHAPLKVSNPSPQYDHALTTRSIFSLHRAPYLLIHHIINPLTQVIMPNPVNNHPLPMASMSGLATIPPTQLKIFLTKLLTATPLELYMGINSVNI